MMLQACVLLIPFLLQGVMIIPVFQIVKSMAFSQTTTYKNNTFNEDSTFRGCKRHFPHLLKKKKTTHWIYGEKKQHRRSSSEKVGLKNASKNWKV